MLKFLKDGDYHCILKIFKDKKEMSLKEFLDLIPKKYGDHRDYYLAANLFNQGFLDWTVRYSHTGLYENEKYNNVEGYPIAIQLYLNSLGKGQQEYKGIKCNVTHFYEGEPIYATSKVDMYFQERKERILTTIVTLSVGIIVAIISSSLTAYFASLLK